MWHGRRTPVHINLLYLDIIESINYKKHKLVIIYLYKMLAVKKNKLLIDTIYIPTNKSLKYIFCLLILYTRTKKIFPENVIGIISLSCKYLEK